MKKYNQIMAEKGEGRRTKERGKAKQIPPSDCHNFYF